MLQLELKSIRPLYAIKSAAQASKLLKQPPTRVQVQAGLIPPGAVRYKHRNAKRERSELNSSLNIKFPTRFSPPDRALKSHSARSGYSALDVKKRRTLTCGSTVRVDEDARPTSGFRAQQPTGSKHLISFLPPRTRVTNPKFGVGLPVQTSIIELVLFVFNIAWVVVRRHSISTAPSPSRRIEAASVVAPAQPSESCARPEKPGGLPELGLGSVRATNLRRKLHAHSRVSLPVRHAVPVRGNLACPEVNRARVNAGPAWVAAGWEGWNGTDNNGAYWDGVLMRLPRTRRRGLPEHADALLVNLSTKWDDEWGTMNGERCAPSPPSSRIPSSLELALPDGPDQEVPT
ncbi:hypothetical protein FB451DRAFT_1380754 [Mycena latifolia]|nr:hypothetical protein FB451DRAFT_1380754 [Mycena latifolia]